MQKGKNGMRRVAALVCSVALFATLLPVQVLATDEGIQEPLTAVTLLNENGEETVSEQGDADNQQEEAVACTKDADCAAETHEEDCPKYVAPDEDEGTDPAVSCTKGEDCAAETHEEGCPKYVAPDEDEGTEPAVSCTKDENCAAETHEEGCPKYVAPVSDGDGDQEKLNNNDSTVMMNENPVSRDVDASAGTGQPLEGAEGSALTWQLTEGVLTISGTGAMKDYGYSGRAQVPWYNDRSTITKVVFADGVTHIGSFAFYQHTNLTSFEMADSVVSFGSGAFQGCSKLVDIPELHENFQDFSTEVFVDAQISEYKVDANNPYYTVKNGILYSKDGTTLVNCPSGKTGDFDQSWLDGVTTIAPYAFRTCKSLTGTLEIPAHITSIGRQAFQNCSGLTGDLTVPNTVTDLDGYYTFAGMTGMKGKLTLGSNITEIASGMFNNSGFTSMEWQGEVTSVDSNAFTGCDFTGFVLPDTLKTVGNRAFSGCSANVGSFGTLEHLTRIGDYAFKSCKFDDITIAAGATVGIYAFNLAEIQSVTVSENATVGENAFNTASIGTVNYNAAVLSNQLFKGATITGTVTFADSVTDVGNKCFDECDGGGTISASLKNIKNIGSTAFKGATFTTDISIPAGATVSSNAFENAALKKVSYNAETASHAAFKGASMDSLTFGDSTKEISAYAFQKSTIGGDVLELGKVETIRSYAFSEATIPATVIVPETATYYDNHVFYGTKGGTTLLVYGAYNMVPTALTHSSQFQTVVITANIVNNDNVTYGDNQKAHNRLNSMPAGHIIYMINDTSRENAKIPNNNGAVGVTNGGTFAADDTFTAGELARPTKDGAIFKGWYESATFEGDAVTSANAGKTYYAKWTGMDDMELQYGAEQKIAANGVENLSGYESDNTSVATVDAKGNVKAVGVGTATISATGTYNEESTTTFKMTVTVTPRPINYTLTNNETGSGSITYNYSDEHHALSDSMTFKWADEPETVVSLTEGADINYTYTVVDQEAPDGGEPLTYDYLPMPVGEYDVSFNLKNPNYTFALDDGTTGNTLTVKVNVTAEGTQRAYLASAAPKADQNFVYNGQGVLPVEGTLNAYAENDSSTSPVNIGTFTVNIEGLNGTSYHSEMSDIAAGTDLSGISGLKLPTEPGTYIITASAVNEDYYLYKSLVFTIKKATVTIAAADKTVITGDSDGLPPLTSEDYTVTGLVGNDKLTTPPTLDYEYGANVDTVGTYDIIPSGAAANADRYTIQYVKGTLHVEKIAIIEGADQTWTQGSGSDLVIRSNADFSDFLRVEVNGNALVRDQDYTVRSGSTIVTIKAAYLDTLAAGDYTFAIVSKTGTASTHFTVKAKAAGESGASGNTGAATTTPAPSGSSITYYTCPACGYHDWTAGADGYQCNHCGYVESVKQLSGYGNVKGVYEPKTSAAAAQSVSSSAIPQTGDVMPVGLMGGATVIAAAAFVALFVLRKRQNND